jgi:hypothetical protein
MPTPDTVTEALALLAAEGYTEDFHLTPGGIGHAWADHPVPLSEAVVDHTFRFEGPTDPADEAIVLGVSCPALGRKGVVVSAFGPTADPESTDLLLALTGPPH